MLFVTYTFPPVRRIGSVRTWNVAKHLARAGWDVTIVTPDPALLTRTERTEEAERSFEREGIKRLLAGHGWRWLAAGTVQCRDGRAVRALGGVGRQIARRLGIDRTVGWIRPAEDVCRSKSPGDFDVVLASGPPFSSFRVAARLSRRLQCPLVLDYRDLWSQNLHVPSPSSTRLERAILRTSAAITVVSASWAAVLDRDFGIGSKTHVISNGYDTEDLKDVKRHDYGHFAIVYTGVLYPPKRTISPLMACLHRLDVETTDVPWLFHYYGKHGSQVIAEAQRYGISRRVALHGNVSRQEALAAVRGANVAVVVTSVVENPTLQDNGMVTGKIFEAIGLGTPILLIAPEKSDAVRVAEIAGRIGSYSAKDVSGMAAFIRGIMRGEIPPTLDPLAFCWDHLGEKMSQVLSDAVRASDTQEAAAQCLD